MKYIDEFRSKDIVKKIKSALNKLPLNKKINLMEVCGTHTVAIFRYGLRDLLPDGVNLVSGPGCPVCVTSQKDIDRIIELSKIKNLIITTFGDMIKVPGTFSSLEKEKASGSDIRVVYSTIDAVNIAKENRDKDVVFIAVGFETTSPAIAATMKMIESYNISNFYLFVSHKTIPSALRALISSDDVKIHGFILPGHVSTIIGASSYNFIADEFKIPCVISGFEPVDILQGIYFLLKQIVEERSLLEVQYKRAVKEHGNIKAKEILYSVFEGCSAEWRGIGEIENSGLKLKKEYEKYDILNKYKVEIKKSQEMKNCICGEILRGIKLPPQCKLFAKVCLPETPYGPCMVSTEGTCSAYYKYGQRK